MNPLSLLWEGVLFPGLIAAFFAALGLWLARSEHPSPSGLHRAVGPFSRGRALALLGQALAFALTSWQVAGWVGFPPLAATAWLPFAAFFFALLAALEPRLNLRRMMLWRLRLVTLMLLAFFLSQKLRGSWEMAHSVGWLSAFCFLGIYLWGAFCRVARTQPPWYAAFTLSGLLGGTALAIGLSGSASLAQTAGALAVALLVYSAAVWKAPLLGGEAIVTFALPLWLGFLFAGHFISELTPLAALCCVAAAVLVSLEKLHLALAPRPPWQRLALPLALMGLFLGAAVIYSYLQAPVTDW